MMNKAVNINRKRITGFDELDVVFRLSVKKVSPTMKINRSVVQRLSRGEKKNVRKYQRNENSEAGYNQPARLSPKYSSPVN